MSMKKISALAVAAFMLVAVAVPASAQTVDVDALKAQIAQLTAMIAQLQGGTTTTGTSTGGYQFTSNLTIGSTGADVTELQKVLVAKGYLVMPAGVAYGNFGPLTQAAVAKWQAASGISPAAGYVGPISRTALNAMAGTTTTTTTTTTTSTGTLTGGAGSVESYDLLSSLNNEEVGEDEEDVKVAGIEIEADDASDIAITAVKLVFDEGTAGSDFEDYASEVSILLDGKEVARVDADEFNDDNDWTKTISLKSGAVIKSGETSKLEVAVSGISNLDSGDAGETWTIDFRSVRFVDAQDASTTEDPGVAATTFSFNSFASAADVKLKAVLSNSSPDSTVVNVDASDDTDGVELLQFTLEAEGSDVEIKDLPITLTVTGATDVDAIVNNLSLSIDGEEFDETVSTSAAAATVTFDDINYTIKKGDKVTVIVKADINDIDASFEEGDTLKAEFTASNRAMVDAEDQTGEDIDSSDKTGTALGDEMAFYDVGIMVTFVSADEEVSVDDGSDDDSATFTIKYKVEAFDGTVYVSDSSVATVAETIPDTTLATAGVRYLVDKGGTATAANLASSVTFTTSNGATDSGITNGIELADGESTEFTLTVVRTNDGSTDDNGLFRVLLKAITWATTDASTQNVYDFDLEDSKTDNVNID